MLIKLIKLAFVILIVGYSSWGSAAPVTSYVPSGTCNTNNVVLRSMMLSGGSEELLSSAHSASSCLVFAGNDDGHANDPIVNIGQKNDGLLNTRYGASNDLFFIEPEDLQNLDNQPLGVADDPGWIHLASVNADMQVNYDQAGPIVPGGLSLSIDDLLNMTFNCVAGRRGECTSVNWVIETDPGIIGDVSQLLGAASFDHLAFSIKVAKGFIIYDFDFIDIFKQELANDPASSLNFQTPYKLSGSLDTDDFENPQGNSTQAISHLNVWARDPADPTQVMEPSSFGILVIALLGLMIARISRKSMLVRW
ncbi:hypothetical protein [Agarivorans sp. Z349TD_8]|uniref:hypothetical protein n=1 Tax=Agarivorans sp. Z349TD_8 TaxID=3421434 RepID=UPI003D7C4A5E